MDKPLLGKLPNSYLTISSSTNESFKSNILDVKFSKINGLSESRSVQRFKVEVDPLMENRNIPHPTTSLETMIHLIKANIGTGVLALPQSLIYSGLAFGCVGIAVIALLCIHCMQMLLQCSHALVIRTKSPPMDYATTAEAAFKSGPKSYHRFAKSARFFTNLCVVVVQLGFCVVYWVFVATNIQTTVNHFDKTLQWDYRIYMALLLVPFLAVAFIPNLKYLAPLSIIGSVFEVAAFCMIFYYLFQDLPNVSTRPQLPDIVNLPLWFGTAIYAFEGIAVLLPLENNIKNPREMRGVTGVVNTPMYIVAILYVAVSFYGYLRFGDTLQGSITLSLPDETLAVVIQILYAAAIFLSLALQFYVPVQIMWPTIETWFPRHKILVQGIFRVLLIALIFGLGALIPQFELFISLVGALGGSYLCIIFPATLHMATFIPEGLSWPSIIKDIIIIVIGFVGFATGTYSSVLSIIEAF